MLNLHEVIELENKWLAYTNKKKKKKYFIIYIILAIFFILVLSSAIFYAYSKGASELEINVKKSNEETKRQIDEKKVKIEKEKILEDKIKVEHKTTVPIKEEKIIVKEVQRVEENNEDILTLNIMNIDVKNSTFKKSQENTQKQSQKQIIKTIPKAVNAGNIVITDLNTKPLETKEELSDLEYLKLKFAETNSIYFALDIADTYYSKGKYKDARDWALTANKINAKNDDSWILFAKSSYKLGFKEQAINSLNNYLKNNNSKKIKEALELIKKGQI